jgi:alpha-galactosidase/6-phospho-beta-glucosidase family protein
MNHLGWYVPEAPDGSDTLAAMADLAVGNDLRDVRLQQAVPTPYVRYYLHPDRILAHQRGRPTRARTLMDLDARLLAGFKADPGGEHPRRGAIAWYRAVLRLLNASVHHPAGATVIAGVLNAGRLPLLPPDIVLELPHYVDAQGALVAAEPVALPPLPQTLLQRHAAYESLLVRALVAGCEPEVMLRALLANPMVHDIDQAVALWELVQTDPVTAAGASEPLSTRATR